MGFDFDGNLTRQHLITPSPYNTICCEDYRQDLLRIPAAPPSLPRFSLPKVNAALCRQGDGTHEFSADLSAHNRAVHVSKGQSDNVPSSFLRSTGSGGCFDTAQYHRLSDHWRFVVGRSVVCVSLFSLLYACISAADLCGGLFGFALWKHHLTPAVASLLDDAWQEKNGS
jgi:hypothetical protein